VRGEASSHCSPAAGIGNKLLDAIRSTRRFVEVAGVTSENTTLDGVDSDMRTTPSEARPLERYGVALLAAVVACGASYAMWPYLNAMPWVFFFAAVMISSWFGGQGPSLLTTAILVVLGRYFFLKPSGSFTLGNGRSTSTFSFPCSDQTTRSRPLLVQPGTSQSGGQWKR
jgi:K+-sensing histidine kinase KdpD